MALVRALVTLEHANALPEDRATNTFHFVTQSNPPSALELNGISDAVEAFYVSIPVGAASAIWSFFSSEMAQIGHSVTFYDLGDAEPRTPLREDFFSLPGSPNGDPLPGEVALVLSFQGVAVSGEPQARKRGRVYIGRLDKDSASAGRPSAPILATLQSAGLALGNAGEASLIWSWAIYSPTSDAAGDPTPFSIVDNGWVDNAFDTQRRRGLAPTARNLFDIFP